MNRTVIRAALRLVRFWFDLLCPPRSDNCSIDLEPFELRKRRDAVIVLGAGATRGASFVDEAAFLRPPLDADFFLQLRASDLAQDPDGQAPLETRRDLVSQCVPRPVRASGPSDLLERVFELAEGDAGIEGRSHLVLSDQHV